MATGVAAAMQITIVIITVIIMLLMFVMRTAMLIEGAEVRDRLYYSVMRTTMMMMRPLGDDVDGEDDKK